MNRNTRRAEEALARIVEATADPKAIAAVVVCRRALDAMKPKRKRIRQALPGQSRAEKRVRQMPAGGRGDEGGRDMTREELANRIQAMCETQAAGTVAAGPAEAVAVALDELFGELATLRATLHPSPAPSMEEIERAIGALCVSIDPAWDDEHDGPLHVAAIGDLMAAIRALPDRYAEGREHDAPGWCHCPCGRAGHALPTPTPEADHG